MTRAAALVVGATTLRRLCPAVLTLLSAVSALATRADEITPTNVGQLRLESTFRTGRPGSGGTPAVSGKLLILQTPFPHEIVALDLSRPGIAEKWRYRPPPSGAAGNFADAGALAAGPAVAEGHVVFATKDGRVIALEADTGAVVWTTQVTAPESGETLVGVPLVAEGKVFVGAGGDNSGARGFITALDATTGRELWRRFSTGPDSEVGIGSSFKPFAADARGTDLGTATWPPDGWRRGGGGVSGPLLFDPATRTLFHGTGHPAPWNPDARPGDNRWTGGLFARDPETGDARWFDGLNPHDPFALGSAPTGLLLDGPWNGKARKLLVHPDPNGYVYVLDRTTGEVLSAAAFTAVSATNGVDLASGRPRVAPERAARQGTMTRDVCPGWPGALGGSPAVSDDGTLLVLPVSRLCMDFEARAVSFIPGTAYVGANVRTKMPAQGSGGAVLGWNLAAGRAAWSVAERFPVAGGVLVLDGIVFYGTLEGLLKAVDARTGRFLWQMQTSSAITGTPVAFRSEDGRRKIAVFSGAGGPFGAVADFDIDGRDATAAHGLANALADLPKAADPIGTLHVFALP